MVTQLPEASPKIRDRRRLLLEYVLRAGSAQIDELTTQFRVSRMTVHRDLEELESQGKVRRVHGGVTVRSSNLVESTLQYRARLADREKDALAKAAAELVEPGQAIIIDDSTTAGRLTEHLQARSPLTVITNNLMVIDQLGSARDIDVVCLGGHLNPRFGAFYGYVCERAVASLRANTLFMSTSTVFGAAAYHQQEEVVKTKRALMAAADRRILMVDSTKFGVSALIKLADLAEFDLVITDGGISPTSAESLRQRGVDLRIVEV